MNKIARKGAVILIVSMGTLACWKAWFNSRSWTLVDDIPISLTKGAHYSSPELPVNLSQQYAIQIRVSNKIAPEILRCQLGAGSRIRPCNPPSPFKIHWVLSSEGKIIQEGGASSEVGELDSGPTESVRTIAFFDLEKGHSYKIDLDMLSDSGDLNVNDPHVYVEEFSHILEDYLFWGGLFKFGCFAAAAIGALLLIGGSIGGFIERHSVPNHNG